MTFIAVSIFVDHPAEVANAIERARKAVDDGAELVEWRMDALVDDPDGIFAALRLLRESPVPCVVTVRSVAEGGLYDGEEGQRMAFLEHLATADLPAGSGPRYIDVELAVWRTSANLRQKALLTVQHPNQARDLTTSLILSAHDMTGRPRDLLQKFQAMADEPACGVIKLAWFARSLRDNVQAFELLMHRVKPTIAQCMGPFGLMSRVLAPKFNALLTFVADSAGNETAPGQPTVRELVEKYRFRNINAKTRVFGVIGWPVEHSRSPAFHNDAFERAKHNAVYLPLPIPGGVNEYEHFKATLGELLAFKPLDFSGASVTIPHKENLVRFVRERKNPRDEIEPFANAIGAANTLVVREDGSLGVFNTDGPAAVECVCEALGRTSAQLNGLRVMILGAGGVARAIAGALALHGAHCVVFNRSAERAVELVAELNNALPQLSSAFAQLKVGDRENLPEAIDVIINCTSVGMAGGPEPEENPLMLLTHPETGEILNQQVTVMETVYAPEVTPLLRIAMKRGCQTIRGMQLFERQAGLQSAMWRATRGPNS